MVSPTIPPTDDHVFGMYRTVELRIARSVGGGHPAASTNSRQVDHPDDVLRLHVISITTAVRECSGPNSTAGRSPPKQSLKINYHSRARSMRHDRLRPHRGRVIGAAEHESMRPASVRALTCPLIARRCGKSLHPGWPQLLAMARRVPDPGMPVTSSRGRQAAVRRTWIGTQRRCALVAGLAHTDLASHRVETCYRAGPKPMTIMYDGSARPR